MKRIITKLIPAFAIILQLPSMAQSDSLVKFLSYDDFMQLVKEEHPLSKQAQLQIQMGEAEVQSARGFFDPKSYADLSQKYFKDQQYYSLLDAGVKVPTWFGIELSAGYENNDGVFLNPENSVPGNGLYFAGVSVPIGQGLFIDQRRAALRSAQIFAEGTLSMQRVLLNDLFLDAANAYWTWFQAYHQREVYVEALAAAQFRLRGVKLSAELGDSPDIDTLEAGIQVQNRMLALQQARLDYLNSTALLNVYLWADGLVPLEVDSTTFPSPLDQVETLVAEPALLLGIDTLINQHPNLALNRFELERLDVERRLKAEMLKPNINLKYQPIVEGVGDQVLTNFNENNYNWGLEFSFPILLRKERGSLNKTKIKIQEKQFDLENKTQEIGFKARASINDWNTTKEQADLYERTTRDYLGLLEGERRLFEAGESSLFLVNRRELGYINARIKLVELISKNKKARVKTYYNLGILGN